MKFFIGIYLVLIGVKGFAFETNWKEVSNKEGVIVSTSEVEGSSVKGFRGETIMEDSIGRILHVLMDDKHHKEWIKRLKRSIVLEELSDGEAIVYQEIELPWPMKNRDFVFWGKIERPIEDKIVLKMKSVEHKDAPETTGIRGDLKESKYLLTRLEKFKTKIEVEVITDPKGMIPKWLVNMIQAKWPIKTFKAIQKELTKNYVKEYSLPPITN
jgi:hypothetical protein